MGITTSGRSVDVLAALDRARDLGMATLVLTGESTEAVVERADVLIGVPSTSTQHIQETNIAVAR